MKKPNGVAAVRIAVALKSVASMAGLWFLSCVFYNWVLVRFALYALMIYVFAKGIYAMVRPNRAASAPGADSAEYSAPAVRKRISGGLPIDVAELLYPEALPSFDAISEAGHSDLRALAYAMKYIDPHDDKPHAQSGLSGLDFGGEKKAFKALLEKGLIKKSTKETVFAKIYTTEEIKSFLQMQGIHAKGKKSELAMLLADSGFHLDQKRYKDKLFELTELGRNLIARKYADKDAAILLAMDAIAGSDFQAAVEAYRGFDARWGFIHTSGKNHTIFANYNFPLSRFKFLLTYPMRELRNTPDFKEKLRACLVAGLMRGEQDKFVLADCFCRICKDGINCPGIVKLYDTEELGYEERGIILERMQANIAADNRYVLAYYIAHILYLSRRVA